MKILAIDPGAKRIGLAACDELGLTTRLIPVMQVSGLLQGAERVARLAKDEGFPKILVGLPLNMDGFEGESAKRSRSFAALLQKRFPPAEAPEIILWDERLTSFEAEMRLREKGIPKAKGRDFLDSVAALVLLEDYLSQLELSGPPQK